MGMLLVGSTQNLAFVRPCCAQQTFIVQAGYHVFELSVAILLLRLRIKWFKARRQNDRPYIDFYLLRRLIEIDGLILTDAFTNTTFLLFQVKTAFVDVRNQRNRLSEIDMDGFILRYFLVKLIRVFDRAVFYASRATRALAF